jgi:hypothetical protein
MDEVRILIGLIFVGVDAGLLSLQIRSLLFWGEWWLLHFVSSMLPFTKEACLDMGKAAAHSTGGWYGRPHPYGCPLNSPLNLDGIGL